MSRSARRANSIIHYSFITEKILFVEALWDEIAVEENDIPVPEFPNQWIVVEALSAHMDSLGKRVITDFSVIEPCSDGTAAFNKYRELHKINNCKEYYFLHTSKETLEIEERLWVGIRINHANPACNKN